MWYEGQAARRTNGVIPACSSYLVNLHFDIKHSRWAKQEHAYSDHVHGHTSGQLQYSVK
jgi:hypothetical protein